jgi:myo-inositol 2-dehydrogenase/D-chiro-inositol 1-dehydrogenase
VYVGACTATIPEIKEIGDHENVSVTMKFPSGSLGIIDQSRFCPYGYDQRLEAFGPKAMLQVHNDMPNRAVATTAEGARR